MSVIEKFFAAAGVRSAALVNAAGLQVLLAESSELSASAITASLRDYDPSMAAATCELDAELAKAGTPLGIIAWGEHAIRLIGFDVPMPAEVVEKCVQPAHFGPDLKAQARAHKSHLLLYYAGASTGTSTGPLQQYVALAAVAGVLHAHGAIVALNEVARTAFPCVALLKVQGYKLALLESMPLLLLYCGFVKMDIQDLPGTWMRTFGNHLFGLPDMALLAKSHAEGQATFDLFCNLLGYLRSSGQSFAPGHTAQIGEDRFIKIRAAESNEYWLESPGLMLVLEVISKREINSGSPSRS